MPRRGRPGTRSCQSLRWSAPRPRSAPRSWGGHGPRHERGDREQQDARDGHAGEARAQPNDARDRSDQRRTCEVADGGDRRHRRPAHLRGGGAPEKPEDRRGGERQASPASAKPTRANTGAGAAEKSPGPSALTHGLALRSARDGSALHCSSAFSIREASANSPPTASSQRLTGGLDHAPLACRLATAGAPALSAAASTSTAAIATRIGPDPSAASRACPTETLATRPSGKAACLVHQAHAVLRLVDGDARVDGDVECPGGDPEHAEQRGKRRRRPGERGERHRGSKREQRRRQRAPAKAVEEEPHRHHRGQRAGGDAPQCEPELRLRGPDLGLDRRQERTPPAPEDPKGAIREQQAAGLGQVRAPAIRAS